jgi:phage antirepressor YoqD-like protein
MDKELELRVATTLQESQQLIEILTNELAKQKGELETWRMVSNSDSWIEMSAVAKTLNYKGFGRNKIFEHLRDINVLRYNNEPYQEYVDKGYFKIIEQKVNLPDCNALVNLKTVVSQKGLDFIRRRLDELD